MIAPSPKKINDTQQPRIKAPIFHLDRQTGLFQGRMLKDLDEFMLYRFLCPQIHEIIFGKGCVIDTLMSAWKGLIIHALI